MTKQPAYDAFLSYNSLDHATVERISTELGTRQCKCFIDRWYLQPGRDWVEALEQALGSSGSVIMFVGPNEMGRWQQRERAWALDRLAGATDFPVIPVLLPGCQPPLGFMKQLMWVDLRDDPGNAEQLDFLAAAIRGETVDRSGKREPRATICPYRGLLAFREEDAEFFFGRQDYTSKLVSLVKQHPLVAVVGASGSGKSSVVRAGLVPKLRSDRQAIWEIATMVPAKQPLNSLLHALAPMLWPEVADEVDLCIKANEKARSLTERNLSLADLVQIALQKQKGSQRLLLVVDQWEELYTECREATERERFIEEVLDATTRTGSPLSVVFTVRWDFFGQILQNRTLLDRLENSRLDLGPMNREELRSVIEQPAEKVGLVFQDGLVERILDDAGNEPGSLPLLEFVLEGLWEKRRGDGQLTHLAYQALGCITGAIATRAETIFNQLNPDEQKAAEFLFRRLVQAGAKTDEDTRRRVDLQGLDSTNQKVARKLASERLLVTTGVAMAKTATDARRNVGTSEPPQVEVRTETVEVAHEELLRRWDRLKQWVDADRQFLQWRSRLVPLLAEFERDPKSALLRGNALRESHQFVPSRVRELEENESGFVIASQKAQQRRKYAFGGIGVLLLLAILITAYAIRQNFRESEANNLVERLLNPEPSTVTYSLQDLEAYRTLAVVRLRKAFEDDQKRSLIQKVHATYGLIHFSSYTPEDVMFLLKQVGDPKVFPKSEGENLLKALSIAYQGNKSAVESGLRDMHQNSTSPIAKNRYVTVAAELGMLDLIKPVCLVQADPSERTSFIHAFSEFPGDLEMITSLLADNELDQEIRSALCIAIGTMKAEGTQATQDVLKDLYRSAPDGGTHSASRWALLQQGVTDENLEALIRERTEIDVTRHWYVSRASGITMLKVLSRHIALGNVTDDKDPTEEDQPLSSFDFDNPVWISDREISVGQFEALMPAELKGQPEQDMSAERIRLLRPATSATWFDAVAFCNRLSKAENLAPYYELDESNATRENGSITATADEVTIIDPLGHGYRLPAEIEWEYACRAMSTRGYFFGDDEKRLPEYGVYNEGDASICGQRIPNAWGLFDMHGNVWEWCWDRFDSSETGLTSSRVLRGGSFDLNYPRLLRSAYRYHDSPDLRDYSSGFRISRTP